MEKILVIVGVWGGLRDVRVLDHTGGCILEGVSGYVVGVLSDEDSSTGVLILSFGVCCRVEVKLGITVGDVHSDDEFVYVSDVSVGFVGLILLSRD